MTSLCANTHIVGLSISFMAKLCKLKHMFWKRVASWRCPFDKHAFLFRVRLRFVLRIGSNAFAVRYMKFNAPFSLSCDHELGSSFGLALCRFGLTYVDNLHA